MLWSESEVFWIGPSVGLSYLDASLPRYRNRCPEAGTTGADLSSLWRTPPTILQGVVSITIVKGGSLILIVVVFLSLCTTSAERVTFVISAPLFHATLKPILYPNVSQIILLPAIQPSTLSYMANSSETRNERPRPQRKIVHLSSRAPNCCQFRG